MHDTSLLFMVTHIHSLTRYVNFGIPTSVACRTMGYANGTVLKSRWPGSGPIWLDNVNCVGQEDHIQFCPRGAWGEHNCYHKEDVAILCFGTARTTQKATKALSVVTSGRITTEKSSKAASTTTSMTETTDVVTLELTGSTV